MLVPSISEVSALWEINITLPKEVSSLCPVAATPAAVISRFLSH